MTTAWIGAITLFAAAVLYILLALGLPYGELAMGGKHKTMPRNMRIVCGVSVVVQLGAAMVLLEAGGVNIAGLPVGIAKGICYFFAAYFSLNTIMNAFSKSKKERFIITPLSAITTICFFITAING